MAFVNGQNLGRYWDIGPQETLYLPGAWLDQGINQVGTLVVPSLFPRVPFPFSPSLVSQCFLGGGRRPCYHLLSLVRAARGRCSFFFPTS